jgi:hypothetical protein
MLALFCVRCVSIYAAVDIGSQYLKVATSIQSAGVSMAPNSRGKLLTPSAVALRLSSYPTRHLTNPEALDCQLKIGEDALRILKREPQAGSEFVPRLLGRTTSTFPLPTIVNASEMFSLLMADVLSPLSSSGIEGVMIVVPNYFTFSQRQDVVKGMWGTAINYHGMIDDSEAIASDFSAKFAKRFTEENLSVLFVDVGATSTKAFRIRFSWNTTSDSPIGNMTSYEFSENCGGEFMARSISEHDHISIKKARTLLNSGSFDRTELFVDTLQDLNSIVRRALNDDVDIVEVFGGASRYQFVIDTIQDAVGEEVPVKRELPPTEALALGGIFYFQGHLNISLYPPLNLTRCSPYDIYVECSGEVDPYCYKSQWCHEGSIVDKDLCNDFYFKTSEAPEGAGELLGYYKLANVSYRKRSYKRWGGFLIFKPPYPVLDMVLWCETGSMNCEPVKIDQEDISPATMAQVRSFLNAVMKGQKEFGKAKAAKARVGALAGRISDYLGSEACAIGEYERQVAADAVKEAERLVRSAATVAQLEVAEEELTAQMHSMKLEL